MATTTSLTFHIFARYHGSPAFNRARRDLNDLDRQSSKNAAKMAKLAKSFNIVQTAAVSLAPALIPIGAHLANIGAGLVAVSAAAGAAGAVWGGVFIAATKRSKEWERETNKLKNTWNAFVDRMAPSVLQPGLTVVNALRNSIAKLEPVVRAVTPVAQGVANAFANWTRNGGLDQFIGLLVKFGVPALRSFANIARSLVTVLGEGFRAFLPTGLSTVQTLERGAAALAKWAQGGGFQRFIAYVNQNSPAVKEFFRALGAALKNVGIALVGVAPLSLMLATALLKIVAAIPPSWLALIIQGFVLWRAAMLGLMIVRGLAAAFFFFRKAVIAARIAWFLLSIAFTASPLGWLVLAIGAVIAVIVVIATKTRWFQNLWGWCWRGIKVVASAVWGWLKAGLRFLWAVIRNNPLAWLLRHWRQVWNGIKIVASAVWNFLKSRVLGPMARFFTGTIPAAAGVFKRGVVGAFNAISSTVGKVWKFIKGIFDKIVAGFKKVKDLAGKLPGMGVVKKIGGFLGKLNPFAQGGPVRGPGSGTSDSVFARLSNGEHVLTAREVVRLGGHQNVMNMRRFAMKGYAAGGPVGPAGGAAGGTTSPVAPSGPAVAQAKTNTQEAISTILAPVASLFSKGLPAAAAVMQTQVSQKMTMLKGQVATAAKGTTDAVSSAWRQTGSNVNSQLSKISQSAHKSSASVGSAWRGARSAVTGHVAAMVRGGFNPMNQQQRNTIPSSANAMGARVRASWNQMRGGVHGTYSQLVNSVYNPTRTMYTRNVPGWSQSMKSGVTRAFQQMKTGVGNAWKGIQGATASPVNWVISNTYSRGIRTLWNAVSNVIFGKGKRQLPAVRRLAAGGPVNGPGGPTADKVPALLSAGEHVWTAQEVRAAGGHRQVARMRSHISGRRARVLGQNRYAEGGGTGGSTSDLVRGNLGGYAAPRIDKLRASMAKAVGKRIPFNEMTSEAMNIKMGEMLDFIFADDAANMFNGFTPFRPWGAGDGRHVGWKGKTFNVRTREMLIKAQGIAKKSLSVYQGSYSSGVAASGGTHSGGGAADVGPAIDQIVGAMRASGFAAWRRTPAEGFSPHIHGIAVGDPTVSGAAANQVRAFFAGRNGLANNGPDTYMPGGGSGSARWAPVVRSVLTELKQAQSNLPNVLKAIQKESGGNPRAINNWDSNAKAGTPSKGLLQVIDPTFNAYAGRYRSLGPYNPKANIYAAINYAMHRYGGGWSARMARPGGYAEGGGVLSFDRGGYLPKGLSLVHNGTGKPEPLKRMDDSGSGEPVSVSFENCTFSGGRGDFEDMVVRAVSEAKRKKRL